jgi:hypothetical protein
MNRRQYKEWAAQRLRVLTLEKAELVKSLNEERALIRKALVNIRACEIVEALNAITNEA